MPERIGRYRILRPLGEGGMGTVYVARDEALDRDVAVKTIRHDRGADNARERFWREARAAARVNHPNVCPIYEVGDEGGEMFLAMELLEGESLGARLSRGALSVSEGVPIALTTLAALEALHRNGVVHRDLKPSNIFLTPHGVKLLDFGLARETTPAPDEATLTQTGTVLGTPHYISPEQILGFEADGRADLFALGGILFEMLAGRPAFAGASVMDVLHAVLHEQPPALVGSAAIAAVDRVIHRALAKKPAERYATADAMARELREAMLAGDSGGIVRARALARFIALPLRVLRPDPETDFLAVSLPEAVSSSLSGSGGLVVRSPVTAARYASEAPDLERLSREVEVDAVLVGTLLRAGDQIRVSTQLIEAPSGTVVCSQSAQVQMCDIFQLQDDLAHRIVQALAIPLTGGETERMRQDTPATPSAYEYFLRGNQHYSQFADLALARDLYLRCLEEDPRFAPAWARLGRVYRIISKYGIEGASEDLAKAEAAFKRALELSPDLSLAHTQYAALEAEMGRARDAMVRLLGRAAARPADPETYVGLCHSLRYCGMLGPSVAAHEHARRLDPSARTSVTFTWYFLGEYQRAFDSDDLDPRYNGALALVDLGRGDEAVAIMERLGRESPSAASRIISGFYIGAFKSDIEACRASADTLLASGFVDPEGWYLMGRNLIRAGDIGRGFIFIESAIEKGFACHPILLRDPWLDSVRGTDTFRRALDMAEPRWRECVAAYEAAGGERVLGVSARA